MHVPFIVVPKSIAVYCRPGTESVRIICGRMCVSGLGKGDELRLVELYCGIFAAAVGPLTTAIFFKIVVTGSELNVSVVAKWSSSMHCGN